ncbi:helix-turn-helix domain-containing protein [uncultured Roseobacter sp.]|uniref:winged helix-turn-helix transcriptional regulator n=1 Tax=uncultured Roseobacter sp. TaxID=114847 RepID=UPI00261419B9|nr:helix-turn-helix domain-containing protein [uncultured Roseobacter sp.]
MPYRGYGQYCPLALAAEVLCERWTLLVISRVIDGCTRFNDIHRGVPKISATLLSKRLAHLEEAGLITRQALPNGRGFSYELTEAAQELDPIIMSLAAWGQKWSRDMEHADLDPAFLAWSMHTRLNIAAMPPCRTVMEFEFSGTHKGFSRFWLVVEDGDVDMCLKFPGFEVDVTVSADIKRFVEAWRGFRNLRDEIASGQISIEGKEAYRRQVPDWLMLSALSKVPRLRGRERDFFEAIPAVGDTTERLAGG